MVYANDDLKKRTADIAKESPTMAREVASAEADPKMIVFVNEKGLVANEQGSKGTFYATDQDSNGVTRSVILVDSVRSTDDDVTEEWGHEKDARAMGGTDFNKAVAADKKQFPDKSQHNARPMEKSAAKYVKTVKEERKAYQEEQKRQRQQQEQEKKRKQEEEKK